MKLPDFEADSDLNSLRAAMKAGLGVYAPPPPLGTLTPDEIERLAGEGIEVPLDEVRVLNDGTHYYKGRRVIVYIRDVAEYGGRVSLPKFHLAMCDTLTRMIEEGRYKKRYVVATRDDGKFSVQRIRADQIQKSDEALDVCQHCLEELNYRSFNLRMSGSTRAEFVRSFSIEGFFSEFGKSCVWATPTFDSTNAPPNIYSPQFYQFAKTIKEKRGYRCEGSSCRLNLSARSDQRFLHAHHIDGDKSDNHPSNIKLLCIRCHSNEFMHSHVRQSPDYKIFCDKFPLSPGAA